MAPRPVVMLIAPEFDEANRPRLLSPVTEVVVVPIEIVDVPLPEAAARTPTLLAPVLAPLLSTVIEPPLPKVTEALSLTPMPDATTPRAWVGKPAPPSVTWMVSPVPATTEAVAPLPVVWAWMPRAPSLLVSDTMIVSLLPTLTVTVPAPMSWMPKLAGSIVIPAAVLTVAAPVLDDRRWMPVRPAKMLALALIVAVEDSVPSPRSAEMPVSVTPAPSAPIWPFCVMLIAPRPESATMPLVAAVRPVPLIVPVVAVTMVIAPVEKPALGVVSALMPSPVAVIAPE